MEFNLWRLESVKFCTLALTHSAGRNSRGRICMKHRGGGTIAHLKIIDFARLSNAQPCRVIRFENDMHRTAYIALICHSNALLTYILAPYGLRITDILESGHRAPLKTGNHIALDFIPEGSLIHNVEISPYLGGQYNRSAGTKAMVLRHSGNLTLVRLRSGEIRYFLSVCNATLGIVSHLESIRESRIFKAGQLSRIGYRPHVRGVAMNPIDHPHGGGHGKTSTGRAPVSAYGKLTKGTKTRLKNKTTAFLFRRRKIE